MIESIGCRYAASGIARQLLLAATPAGFSLDEVVVRLVRADERIKWDVLMDQHHYLGFKRFAGRGLHLCGGRGRWIDWPAGRPQPSSVRHAIAGLAARQEDVQRLHLISANTPAWCWVSAGYLPRLAAALHRLSDDCTDIRRASLTRHGSSANWSYVGNARAMRAATVTTPPVRARVAQRRVRHTAPRGELADCWQARVPTAAGNEIAACPVCQSRRGQGRKHAGDRAYLLAMLSNMVGRWRPPSTRRRSGGTEAPRATGRSSRPPNRHSPGGDDARWKRCSSARRRACRHPSAAHGTLRPTASGWTQRHDALETATLVEHRTGVPVASLKLSRSERRTGGGRGTWRWFRSVAQ